MYILLLICLLGSTNFQNREKAFSILKKECYLNYSILAHQAKVNKDEEIKRRCEILSEMAWKKLSTEERFKILSQLRPGGTRKLPWLWEYGSGPWNDYAHLVKRDCPHESGHGYPRWDEWREATLGWLKEMARDGESLASVRRYLEDMWRAELEERSYGR